MQATKEKAYYTPQFSAMACITVRRLAWSLGLSMPKTLDKIIKALPLLYTPSVVCKLCKDNSRCNLCGFNQPAVEKAVIQNAS